MTHTCDQDTLSEGPTSSGGPSLGGVLLRRKLLLLFGAAVGVGLGYLHFARQAPVYRATTRILVTREHDPLPTEVPKAAESGLVDAVETQCLVLTSPTIIASAVNSSGLEKRAEFGSSEAAASRILSGLSAAPAGRQTEVIEVAYIGSSPEECRAVLTAVIKAYREFLGENEQAVAEKTGQLVAEAKDGLLRDLIGLDTEYAKFRNEAPLLWQGDQGVNPHAARLAEVERQRTRLILSRSQLEAKIAAVETTIRRGGDRESLALMLDQIRKGEAESASSGPRSEALSTAERLFPLLLEKELLGENLGSDHPKVRSIERQIRLTRDHIDSLFEARGNGAEKPRDLLDVYLDSLRYEVETVESQDRELAALFEREKTAARQLDGYLTRDKQLREEIGRKDRLLDAIVKRLDEMTLFTNRGIRTQVIAEPGPGVRTSGQMNKAMTVGGVLGMLVTFGLGYVLEANDRSFRSPEDIRDQLGAAVIGHVPVLPLVNVATGTRLSSALCTIHSPKAATSEAFRLVRTALFFGANARNLKVVQITSPDQGDGKSTVSANLAICVAHSGRRTLLIDADMRRPALNKMFDVPNGVGLAAVTDGTSDPAEAVRESGVSNLWILPCGGRPNNPAELLSSQAFDEFLGWARSRYDFVIFDTPPLLAVSDPGNVAARVDGVLLTLRLGKRARSKASESREILDRCGANLLGVVINGVNARGEYGYRSIYRYTYPDSYRHRQSQSGDSYALDEQMSRPGSVRADRLQPVTHATPE